MFHKKESTFKDELSHTFDKLWRPYLLFWIIGFIINTISRYLEGDINWIHYTLSPIKQTIFYGGTNSGALPMWFLVTFFIVRILSPITLKAFKGYGWVVCGIIGFILCWFRNNNNPIHPFFITNFFPAMFFYGLGTSLKDIQFSKSSFIISFIIYIVSFIHPSLVDFQTNTLIKGNIPFWYIFATAGIVLFNNISVRIKFPIWPFTYIGNSSMYWFLLHWPILVIVNKVYLFYFHISEWKLAILEFITVLFILFIVKPIFSHTILRNWL